MTSVAVGLVSYKRPEYGLQALEAIQKLPIDFHVVVTDCSPVAAAKNEAVEEMLAGGADWLFLAEDDVIPHDPRAITGYLEACDYSGYGHLMFHAHGPMNQMSLGASLDAVGQPYPRVTLWPQCVGAWCIYRKSCFEDCGLFDEGFVNGLEHVELSLRLAQAGFASLPPGFADATGSENWISEIPESYENSTIDKARFQEAKDYWKATRPDTYSLLWRD